MISEKLHEVESPLYVFEGAEPPVQYKAESNEPDEVELIDWLGGDPSFWKLRLRKAANAKSKFPDWLFGILMPVVCFAFDPFVFKEGGFNSTGGLLSAYRPFAYSLSFMCIMALLAWLLWGEKLKGGAAVVSGILISGAFFSLLIGIVLFPFSLLGLIVVIGALGFTPLFTFNVFWRNSLRAFIAATPYFEKGLLTRTVGLVSLLSIAGPIVLNAALGMNIVARLLDIVAR
jgi:hypothetical protein